MADTRPIIYLDVDDTLLEFPGGARIGRELAPLFYKLYPSGKAAIGAPDFVRWAVKHCEVRWLTSWCPSGSMDDIDNKRLAMLLQLPVEVLEQIKNPKTWPRHKTDGIDFSETRPWFHVEDWISSEDRAVYETHGVPYRYIRCNVSENPYDLLKAWLKLSQCLGIKMPEKSEFDHRNMHLCFPARKGYGTN